MGFIQHVSSIWCLHLMYQRWELDSLWLHKHASLLIYFHKFHMKCTISSWRWHGAIFARMGWNLSLAGVPPFIMFPPSFIFGYCQPLQLPWYLETTCTSASTGSTYTMMKPSPHLGLLITRHSHDFTSTVRVILKFIPLQLIR